MVAAIVVTICFYFLVMGGIKLTTAVVIVNVVKAVVVAALVVTLCF